MISKKFYLYFITEKLEELNLDYVKKTGAILILRNPEKFKRKHLEKFNSECSKRNIALFIPNNLKILFLLRSNKFYISAYNKKQYKHLKKINSKIKIIGSAHNIAEINEKIDQGCDQIVLSRIFGTSYKYKSAHLVTVKFNLLTRNFSKKFVALGGINEKNYRKINTLNIHGCAISKNKKKAGNFLPAFYKN